MGISHKPALLTTLQKTAYVPYFSPSCLFLETILRSKRIPYEVIQCSIWNTVPHEHHYPTVEADGYRFPHFMEGLDYLLAKYGRSIDAGLLPAERAHALALSTMLDELTWMLGFSRAKDLSWLRNDRKIVEDFGRIELYFWRNLIVPRMQKRVKRRVRAYGLSGKSAMKDVEMRTEAMLDALSTLLASNKYFFNVSEPTWLDCKAFAVLAQFKYTPIHNEARIKQFMRDKTPNLMTFVTRLRDDFWSDWMTMEAD